MNDQGDDDGDDAGSADDDGDESDDDDGDGAEKCVLLCVCASVCIFESLLYRWRLRGCCEARKSCMAEGGS